MSRVLFVLIVSSVYLAMNWYVLARLVCLLGLRRGAWFYAALLPLTLSFIAALALDSAVGNRVTGAFFSVAMLWLGVCGTLLWILLAQQLLSLLIPGPPRIWAAAVCSLACGLVLYGALNAATLTVRREQVAGLPLRVVQLSDIHVGSIWPWMLPRIIAETNALRPDLILITGDVFDNANPKTREQAGQLAAFAAPVLFTSGNHEVYTGLENVREMIRGTGIRWLRNEATELQGIRVVGLDNSYGTELMQAVLPGLPPSPAFTILMNHQPRGFDVAARHGVHLTLSGHVHRGQIWPFNSVVGMFFPYLSGLHREGRGFLNVSTGTGFWGPPLRLGSHTEIVVLEGERTGVRGEGLGVGEEPRIEAARTR